MEENIVAIIYDYDKTLAKDYMQKYLFEHFGIDRYDFWKGKEELKAKLISDGIDLDDINLYLYHTINMAREGGCLEGLTKEVFNEIGEKIDNFFQGIPAFFGKMKETIIYEQLTNIKLENYIISAGFKDMLLSSKIAKHMDNIYACEFIYDNKGRPDGVAKAFTIAEKPSTVIRISKGHGHRENITSDSLVETYRIPIENIIIIGDGGTDTAMMKLAGKYGAKRIAVYDPEVTDPSTTEGYKLLERGIADHLFPADYRQGSRLYNKVAETITGISERIAGK